MKARIFEQYAHTLDCLAEEPETDDPDSRARLLKACAHGMRDARTLVERVAVLEAQIENAPRAISTEADFDAMTWTFQIGPECRTGGGIYALVWLGLNV